MNDVLDFMREARAAAYEESWRLRNEYRTYPLANIARYCPDGRLSVRGLKAVTRLGWNRCELWVRAGSLDESSADLIACSIGVHPSEVWPEWWDNAA